jgi:hypothetical protein
MKKKCPLLVRVCSNGIKCKHVFGGNFAHTTDINSGSRRDFDLYDKEEKKSGAMIFSLKYCKKDFETCYYYKQHFNINESE